MNVIDRARDYLLRRKQSYLHVFTGIHGEEVLRDLAKFCRAHESCFHSDQRAHAVMEGRREVWLRIQQHLKMDADQLWNLHKPRGHDD